MNEKHEPKDSTLYLLILILSIVMLLFSSGTVKAAEGGSRARDLQTAAIFWQDQQKAIDELVGNWAAGKSREELVKPVKELVLAENGLLAFGVDFHDARLMARLAKGLQPTEIEQYAARVFRTRMDRFGYPPAAAASTFKGRSYQVRVADGGVYLDVMF